LFAIVQTLEDGTMKNVLRSVANESLFLAKELEQLFIVYKVCNSLEANIASFRFALRFYITALEVGSIIRSVLSCLFVCGFSCVCKSQMI
jgi:hypothetical protein